MQFKFANGVRVGQQNDLKWLPLLPGCGTQHPHRALGGTCVLLAAAPTTPPCFRRWRRSSSLLAMFSGKIIFNFAFAERSAAMKAPVGLLSGRAVCVSRWRGFAPTSSAERSKRYFHGRGRRGKRHLQRRFLRKRSAAGGRSLPLGGAVAQRLRGYGWRSEKSVKAIAPTGAALAFLCFDFFFRIVKGVQPLTTGCGTQHPLRALSGTRVLLAAAPTTAPCFRRWRRSQLLHCGVSGVQR